MVLSPESEFFRYFGSNGNIPAANTNLARPIQPAPAPELPSSNGPALDGLNIEDSTIPSITLEDGSELAPTVGTDIPAPAEAPPPAAAPAPAAQ
jgi:membrane protease subunit HflC